MCVRTAGSRVVLVRAGQGPCGAGLALPRRRVRRHPHAPDGNVVTGAHEALLERERRRAVPGPFWVYAAGTPPSLRTSKEVYEVGEPIRVRWRAAPGYRFDWMGVFSPGRGPAQNAEDCNAGTCGNGHYLLYDYTETLIQGSALIGPASFAGCTWPLKVGTAEDACLMDDGYRLLGISNTFKIVHAAGTLPARRLAEEIGVAATRGARATVGAEMSRS